MNQLDGLARRHLDDSLQTIQAAADSADFVASLEKAAEIVIAAYKRGGKLLLAGNGGSAADAQHIAGEFLSRLNFDRGPLAAVALTVDTSVLTAIGNDYGFERVFERQVRGLGRPGDVLIAISTSGRSANILRALEAAREGGLSTIGFGGEGETELSRLSDIVIAAPSSATPLIQQVHIVAAHIICGIVEAALFAKPE